MRYCYNHPSMGATTVCEACGRGICAACITHVDNHVYCRDCAVEERKTLTEPVASDQNMPVGLLPPVQESSRPGQEPGKPDARPEVRLSPEPSPVKKPAPEAPPAPSETVAMVPSVPSSVAPKTTSQPPAIPAPATPPVPGEHAPKESLLAAILSFVVPGLGQVYNGHTKKGIALALLFYGLFVIIISLIAMSVIFYLAPIAICFAPGLLFPALVLIYAVLDAYKSAEKINRGETTKDWL